EMAECPGPGMDGEAHKLGRAPQGDVADGHELSIWRPVHALRAVPIYDDVVHHRGERVRIDSRQSSVARIEQICRHPRDGHPARWDTGRRGVPPPDVGEPATALRRELVS